MPNHHISIPRVKYTRGCIMLYVNYYNLLFTQAWIPDNHIFRDNSDMYGLEAEPHITLLSGVSNGVSLKRVETAISNIIIPDTVDLETKLSTFEPNNKGATPLKYDVSNSSYDVLHNIHKSLKDELPNDYQYDGFNPHLTVAFIKEKYINHYGDTVSSDNNIISHTVKSKQKSINKSTQSLNAMYIVYTTPAGDKWVIDN